MARLILALLPIILASSYAFQLPALSDEVQEIVSPLFDSFLTEIKTLEEENTHLKREVTDLKAQLRGTPDACIEYIPSTWTMTWLEAESYCQDVGGNLAVNGMQDFSTRT